MPFIFISIFAFMLMYIHILLCIVVVVIVIDRQISRKCNHFVFYTFLLLNSWVILQQGADTAELALCYFKSPKDRDPKGWIYLRDITEISDDRASFTLISTSRMMTLEAGTNLETKLWLQGIIRLCPQANIDNVMTNLTTRKLG